MNSAYDYGVLFSNRLRILARNEYGNSISAMARDCNIPLRTLQSYIYDYRNPSIENLFKIKKATGVSVDWLLGASNQ